jgi:hypothetical protein
MEPNHSKHRRRATPPHSVDAEQGVLGSMLQLHGGKEAIAEASTKLDAEHFFHPAHKTIFTVICDMHESGKPADIITLCDELSDRGLLDSVGNRPFVTDLSTFVPTAANIQYYIEIIRNKYSLREQLAACTEGAQRCLDEQDDPLATLEIIESKLASIRSLHGVDGIQDDAAAVLETEIKLPTDVVCGAIYHATKAAIGGASKSYKTWLLLDLAISVATGTAWMGKLETNKGRVLFVNFELPRPFLNRRIQAICDDHQVNVDRDMLTVWHLRGRIRDWPRLQRRIRPGQFDLIILDPVYKLLLLSGSQFGVRDENAAGHIALLLDEMEALPTRTGAAMVFGSHFSKGSQAGKESIDRISGSGVWARDPDTLIIFTKHEQEECYSVEITLRLHAPIQPFVVRWEFPSFLADSLLDPRKLKKPSGAAQKQFHAEELLALLKHRPLKADKWMEKATKKFGMSDRTFRRLFKELRESSKVVATRENTWKQAEPPNS